jgi:hypothetical protein
MGLTYIEETMIMCTYVRMNHDENERKPQKQSPRKSLFSLLGSSMVQENTWFIVTMLTEDYIPLSIVESIRFKTLLSRHELDCLID